jgi:excisionase family DNA binding protein
VSSLRQPTLPGAWAGPDSPNPDPLLTTKQAGEYLGFSDEFVRQQIAAGLIAIVQLGRPKRPRLRIRRSALEAYITASTSTRD